MLVLPPQLLVQALEPKGGTRRGLESLPRGARAGWGPARRRAGLEEGGVLGRGLCGVEPG